ncbi:MAG: hypothetical protein FD164_1136 [Nitrospirae bacterium]|nr:MAG: hypothetical protein FD164_1136 [Nitrospirota bacterium]
MPIEGFQEEFIVGAWHPFVDLHFDTSQLPLFSNISINKGRNWIILSSCTPFQQKGKGLVHQAYGVNLRSNNSNSVLDAIAFRGYILDPPVHSWSDSSTILNYWSKKNSQYNGVFSTVIIKNKGRELSFISDAFGISTLYYRKHGSLVLFSTNSRFLASADDNFDYISGRILLQCGSVYGNRTLIEGVNRVASGSIMMFFRETTTEQKWFSFDKLPEGTRVLNFAALHEIESAFQTAIQRCLRLGRPPEKLCHL